MEIAQTIEQVRFAVAAAKRAGKTVGFVPTMGALHDGHATLIDAAWRQCGFVVVSIFVNPTQFGPNEDLSRYPRTPQADQSQCRQHGADLIFMPSVETMYGSNRLTEVRVDALSGSLCGASRPGHFAGVCTVVAKLFNIVGPDAAFFGAKDFQQATIIRKMTADLDFPTEIVVCPTIRESDGLAMSSRNRYLTAQERTQAPALYQSLELAREMVTQRHPPADEVKAAILAHLAAQAPAGTVDYVEIVDPDTLQNVATTDKPVQVVLAVKFPSARLIDNMALTS